MRIICIILLISSFFQAKGQNFTLKNGDFMDTTLTNNPACKSYYSYYYSYNAKYPQSSATTLKNVKAFLRYDNFSIPTAASGYITFKFIIDCDGKMSYVKVLQTDEKYNTKKFEKPLVEELYQFLKTLDNWKKAKYEDKIPINYFAFMSFKIQNGEIINIIP